ncbi:MAG: tRNA uridine-5-carboxymethylaminomethyl(34) synthesis GTPase MnmE [Blastocatellia bacterium]|nr:tRNA uridine-5-carboxymethylaminomethyl(34) synthesis GTPase MnmE [Blastocatellia bacterium]
MSLLFLDDTIAAISTPIGRAGIGVVRISGSLAKDIATKLAPKNSFNSSHRAQLIQIYNPADGEFLDEAVAIYFSAPKSYTGEDVVEISCHGSPYILSQLLKACLKLGARTASPGEFTFRAFVNGRIDLTQAEAVRDLIDSQTEYQAKLASRQLKGELSRYLQPIKEELLKIIVHLESSVEFVEEVLDTDSIDALELQISQLIQRLERLAKSYNTGRIVREGFKLALIGRPNVGKSSLFNSLLQQDRAIVTDIPGTTRDSLIETASIGGIPVKLVDTAGIREAGDIVEKLGIERSYAAIADADLVLHILDTSCTLTNDDLQLISYCKQTYSPAILVLNKIDLQQHIDLASISEEFDKDNIVKVSAKTFEGIDILQDRITAHFIDKRIESHEDTLILDARHFDLVNNTIEQMQYALTRLREGYSEEVALYHLHNALKHLGEITGETTIEDILGKIFATFCIGK